jgi:hypothetical protein
LDAVKELVHRTYPKRHWLKKRQRLLEDAIDVTGWLVRLVEHFGETRNADLAAGWALREAESEERLAG